MIYLSGVRTRVFVCEDDVVVNKRRRRGIPGWWGKRLTRARRYIRRCRCNRSTPIWRCSCERRDALKGDKGVALNGAHRSALAFWILTEFQSRSAREICSSFPVSFTPVLNGKKIRLSIRALYYYNYGFLA